MPPKPRPEQSSWRSSWLLKSVLLLLFVALFLGGVIWAGRWGLEQLRDSKRYDIPFTDIECEPPVGMDRHKFLDEVRYYARLPEQVNVLDDNLPRLLTEGFAKHPWVERVDRVDIEAPKQITVKLTHRKPVLAVKAGTELFAVDGAGVLLPKNAPAHGLPIFEGVAKEPRAIGQRWGDPNVEAAARKLRK